jgi:hypothetical protein
MGKFTDNELAILYKLWRNRCFGQGHMLTDNLTDGFPTNVQDKIAESLRELIRKGFLVRKSTRHGQAVFINLNMRKQIETELKNKYSFL